MSDTLAGVFRNALGSGPAEFSRGGALSAEDIEAIRVFYVEWLDDSEDLHHPLDELWPLISHHEGRDTPAALRNFVARANPAGGSNLEKPVFDRLKTHLAAFHRVVLADPLRRVFFDVDGHPRKATSGDIHRVAARVGYIEHLMDAGLVHISRVHPLLASDHRDQFIAPFNLGDDLQTLTDLLQWGYYPSPYAGDTAAYPVEVKKLLKACGVLEAVPESLAPVHALELFARTLMEVSWQLAHVTATGADLYLTTPLEVRTFEVLVEAASDELSHIDVIEKTSGQAKHVTRLARVGIPAIDIDKVDMKDLIDMRSGDAFANWRHNLNLALNNYAATPAHLGQRFAVSAFRDEMQNAADELAAASKRAGGTKYWFKQGAIPAALSFAVTGMAESISGSTASSLAAAAGGAGILAFALTLHKYFTERDSKDTRAAIRFMSAFNQ